MTEISEPIDDALDAFWEEARIRAKLNNLEPIWGRKPLDSLRPPASAFGDTAKLADELAALIVAGTKTATSAARAAYEAAGEPLPTVGGMEIVVDGRGHPRALIATTAVAVVPFDQVPASHAAKEGEGDGTLAYWRRAHQRFFRAEAADGGAAFTPTMDVVCQEFRVIWAP